MNDTTTKPTPTPAKPKKAPRTGLFRWEAIGPFTVFVLIVWAYFFFFFDTHLKHGLQYVLTHANGAEVDIATVRTSFWNASAEFDKIEITDGTTPTKNKIQLGKMHWQMSWDALLRGKILIDDASILDIAMGVPRAHAGYVLPPPPPSTESGTEKLEKQALGNIESEFKGNVLGDAASLLNGADPKAALANLQGNLKSSAMITSLQADLQKKEGEWKDRLSHLPQQKELNSLQDRLKAIKTNNFANPGEIQNSLQQFSAVLNDANDKYKQIQETAGALNSDVTTYQASLKGLEAQIKSDVSDLESRFKIPKLDAATISKALFGPVFMNKVNQARFYMDKARQYMPAKKSKEELAAEAPLKPHEREKGRNYKFPRTNAYPMFWLKHASLSSKSTPGADMSGDLTGTLTNVTNDQPLIGKPTIAEFQGDFPKQGFHGVVGKITIDHTTDNPVESALVRVGAYPITGQDLVKSDDVTLGFANAAASGEFNAALMAHEIKITSTNLFTRAASSPTFLTSSAKQPILADLLKSALAEIPKVDVNASVSGKWDSLAFTLNSTLGQDLSNAFEKQLKAKIAEARAKLESYVNDQIGAKKALLMAEFDKNKAQIDSVIQGKKDEIDKARKQVEAAKDQAVNGQKKQLQDQGQKALDQLKNQLHF